MIGLHRFPTVLPEAIFPLPRFAPRSLHKSPLEPGYFAVKLLINLVHSKGSVRLITIALIFKWNPTPSDKA